MSNQDPRELMERIAQEVERMKKEPHDFKKYAEITRQIAGVANEIGGYYMAVPEDLLQRGRRYFEDNAPTVQRTLTGKGVEASTVEAVIKDYAGALVGIWRHQATPEQMREVLDKCDPMAAYIADKRAFWFLLWNYQRSILNLDQYTRCIKQEDNAERRAEWFNEKIKAADEYADIVAAGWWWLYETGYITISDFAGVDTGIIRQFLDYIQLYGHTALFTLYYYIATRTLNASDDQLQQLNAPPIFHATASPIIDAVQYAEILAAGWDEVLRNYEESAQAVVEAETPEQIQEAKQNARVLSLSNVYTKLASRRLNFAVGTNIKDGQRVNDILPIRVAIEDYIKRNPAVSAVVTPNTLGKCVEAINILQQIKRVQPDNETYSIETNISEFAAVCGYNDANEKEKEELFTALRILDGIFLVLWDKNGRYAKRLFTIDTIGLTQKYSGYLKLRVFQSGFKGKPNLVSKFELDLMANNEKGEAQRHFRNQILSKGQKKAEALQAEIFSYADKIAEAELSEDKEQVRGVKEYIRKHKARDKRELHKMFERYKKDGVLEYSLTINEQGEEVYKWRRLLRQEDTQLPVEE